MLIWVQENIKVEGFFLSGFHNYVPVISLEHTTVTCTTQLMLLMWFCLRTQQIYTNFQADQQNLTEENETFSCTFLMPLKFSTQIKINKTGMTGQSSAETHIRQNLKDSAVKTVSEKTRMWMFVLDSKMQLFSHVMTWKSNMFVILSMLYMKKKTKKKL